MRLELLDLGNHIESQGCQKNFGINRELSIELLRQQRIATGFLKAAREVGELIASELQPGRRFVAAECEQAIRTLLDRFIHVEARD